MVKCRERCTTERPGLKQDGMIERQPTARKDILNLRFFLLLVQSLVHGQHLLEGLVQKKKSWWLVVILPACRAESWSTRRHQCRPCNQVFVVEAGIRPGRIL